MKREHVLTHPSQLNALFTFPFGRMRGVGTLRLGGSVAEHPERGRWERQLNRDFYACGCDTGATGVMLGLLVGIVAAVYARFAGDWGTGSAVGLAFGTAVAGGVLGKLVGVSSARVRLRRTIAEIQGAWKPARDQVPDPWDCG